MSWDPQTPGGRYTKRLFQQENTNVDEQVRPGRSAVRLWTSAITEASLSEFCTILCEVVREDWPELMSHSASVMRAINQECCVGNHRLGEAAVRPPGGVCYRGGGFNDACRGFFTAERKFRQPAFLATSFQEHVARRFIARSTMSSRVLWRIIIDPQRGCMHANLINEDLTNVQGESEYLFAPYSVFTVRRATWAAGTVADPHVIELLAAPDNRGEPLDLQLAPWS